MSPTPEQSARDVLARVRVMVLSTLGPEGTWTTPLGFEASDDLRITFLSRLESQHMRDIQANPQVSLALYSAEGEAGGNIGLQIRGSARIVRLGGPGQWSQVDVTPSEVWVYDSRDPRRRRRPVDLGLISRTG